MHNLVIFSNKIGLRVRLMVDTGTEFFLLQESIYNNV